jgi:hypothetical protein
MVSEGANEQVDSPLDDMGQSIEALRTDMNRSIAALRADMNRGFDRLNIMLGGSWVTIMGTIIGLNIAG